MLRYLFYMSCVATTSQILVNCPKSLLFFLSRDTQSMNGQETFAGGMNERQDSLWANYQYFPLNEVVLALWRKAICYENSKICVARDSRFCRLQDVLAIKLRDFLYFIDDATGFLACGRTNILNDVSALADVLKTIVRKVLAKEYKERALL